MVTNVGGFDFEVNVNDRGLRRGRRATQRFQRGASRDLAGVDASFKNLEGSINRARNTTLTLITAFGALQAVRGVVNLTDEFTNINNQIRAATRNTGEFTEVQAALRDIASETFTPLNTSVNLYREIVALRPELNQTLADEEKFIRGINQAAALSGASSVEISNALRQLSQGLASGVLRAQEYASIVEQLPALAQALADGLGVTRGQLRLLVNDGKVLSSQVFGAILKQSEDLNTRFQELEVPISGELTRLNNQLIETAGAFNEAFGTASTFKDGIRVLTGALDLYEEHLISIANRQERLFTGAQGGGAGIITPDLTRPSSSDSFGSQLNQLAQQGNQSRLSARADEESALAAEPAGETEVEKAEREAKERLVIEEAFLTERNALFTRFGARDDSQVATLQKLQETQARELELFGQTEESKNEILRRYEDERSEIIADFEGDRDDFLSTLGPQKDQYEVQLEELQDYKDREIEIYRESGREITDLIQFYADREDEIKKQQAENNFQIGGQLVSDSLSNLTDAFAGFAGQSEKAFNNWKAFATAQALVNAALAISGAFAAPDPTGGILNAIKAVTIGIAAGAQVAKIQGTQYQGRQQGGSVAAGGIYGVGENNRPEILRTRQGENFLIPGVDGAIIPMGASRSRQPIINININNMAGVGVEVNNRGNGNIDVQLIAQIIASDITSGTSPINSALQSTQQ